MTRWVKIYLVVTTVALLGLLVFLAFSVLPGRSQHNDSPEIIGNIVVSGRFVTPQQLDDLVNAPNSANAGRVPKSGLYLVTRAWLNKLPAGRVVSARAEFTSPEFLKGHRISIGGGFLGEAGYNVEALEFIKLSEEQMKIALSTNPELRVVDAWVK